MSQKRQLAAIMFTDVVGYTALMGKDEDRALGILQKVRNVLKPLVSQYNGTWQKEIGDGERIYQGKELQFEIWLTREYSHFL